MRRASCTIFTFLAVAACGRESTAPNATPLPALTAQNSTIGAPSGWYAYLGVPASFTTGVETASAHSGTRAAYLTNASASPSDSTFATIEQFVQAGAYLGKRVRLSAWVRASGITLPTAQAAADGKAAPVSGLWMRVDGYGLMLGFDNMSGRPVVGTTDWKQVSIVLDVPTYALGISFGALFSGSGALLVDDVVLETVSTSTPTTNVLKAEIPVAGDPENTVVAYGRDPVAPTNLGFEVATTAAAATRAAQRRGIERP